MKTTDTDPQTTPQTTPCGWCDAPVATPDLGQIEYCTERCARLSVYTPEAEGNI